MMARLIEVPDARTCPPALTVLPGDVLLFHATGGHVRSGNQAIDLLGPYLQAVLGDNGAVLAPAGAPNLVLFWARRPGRARIEVIAGDPWHAPQTVTLEITIES
jgi:hypothetical protein